MRYLLILLLMACACFAQDEVVDTNVAEANGLVLCFPFNEGSGSTITDKASSIVGTINGSMTWNTGYINADASGEYISLGSSVSLGSDFTIMFYVRVGLASPTNNAITGYSSSAAIYARQDTTTKISLYDSLRGNWNDVPTEDFDTDEWHIVAFTVSTSTGVSAYHNGTLTQTSADTSGDAWSINQVFSRNPAGEYFTGDLGWIYMWDRALSESELDNLSANPDMIFESASSGNYFMALAP